MNANHRSITTLILAALALLMFNEAAFAQALDNNNALDAIVIEFRNVASTWVAPLITIATAVFWTLVVIDWVLTFGYLALEGAGFEGFASALMRRVIFVTFGAWVLLNPGYLADLVTGFRDSANVATGISGFAPSDFFDSGMKLVTQIWERFSIFDGDSWGLALVSIIILISISITAAWLVLTLVEMYIVMFGGVILLGFFGSNHTKEYAMRYFGYLFSVGMKLFVITLIAGIGIALLTTWVDTLGNTAPAFLVMAGASIVMAVLTVQIPQLVQSFVAGVSGTSGMGMLQTAGSIGGRVGSMAVGAAAATAGGAMSVAQASKLASAQGHTGLAKASAVVGNLAKSATDDIQKQMSGNINTQQGSMGARMAGEMKADRIGMGSDGNSSKSKGGGNNSGGSQGGNDGGGNNGGKPTGSITAADADTGGGSPRRSKVGSASESLGGGLSGSYISGASGDADEMSQALGIDGNEESQLNTSASSSSNDGNTDPTERSAQNASSGGAPDQSSDDIQRINSQEARGDSVKGAANQARSGGSPDQSSDDLARMATQTSSNDPVKGAASHARSGGSPDQSTDDLIRTGQTGGTNYGGSSSTTANAPSSNDTGSRGGGTQSSSSSATNVGGGESPVGSSSIDSSNAGSSWDGGDTSFGSTESGNSDGMDTSSGKTLRAGSSTQDRPLMGDALGGYKRNYDSTSQAARNASSGGVSDKSSDDLLRMKNQQLKDRLRRAKDKK